MTPRTWLAAVATATVAIASAAVLATPASSTPPHCPPGETKDLFTGVCMPTPPTNVITEVTPAHGGPPQIDGVPCTGHNSYECIGLAEEGLAAGPTPSPSASISHGP